MKKHLTKTVGKKVARKIMRKVKRTAKREERKVIKKQKTFEKHENKLVSAVVKKLRAVGEKVAKQITQEALHNGSKPRAAVQ